MRFPLFATVPLALLLAAVPAQAQVSVGVHIDIPIIGHGNGGQYGRGPTRQVRVYEYPPVPYGQWKKHYRNWNRETLYVYDGRYYDYPVRGGRVVYVYRDNDRYFWGPGDGDWNDWDRWDGGRNVRYDRDGRDDRYDRDDRNYRYDRNGNGRDDRYEYRARPVQRDNRSDQDHQRNQVYQGYPNSRDDQVGRGGQENRGDQGNRGNKADRGNKGRGGDANRGQEQRGGGRGRRGN